MFEFHWSPLEVSLGAVASTREGWASRAVDHRSGQRLLGLPVESLSADEALSALVALSEQEAALAAVRARLLVQVAGATRVVRDVLVDAENCGAPRRVEIVDEVAAEVAAVLHLGEGTVRRQVEHARLLAGPLARTREQLAQGRVSAAAVAQVCDQAARMQRRPLGHDARLDADFTDLCGRLQDRILPRIADETPWQVRARVRRVVESIDAVGACQRRKRARRGCDVQAWGEDDGLAVVMARLSALDAATVMGRVEALVRSDTDRLADLVTTRTGDPEPTLGQLRAAAFTELVSAGGSGTNANVSVELHVVVDAATVIGLSPQGVARVRVGAGEPASVDRDDLLTLLTDPNTPTVLRRLVSDPLTGALVDRGARTYAVSAELAAWIAARDRTCRQPGCTRPADRCDIDHARDFRDGGPTTIANTGAQCRRHHNIKTHGEWRIEDAQPDGSCTFISPTGRRYFHRPVPLLDEPPP